MLTSIHRRRCFASKTLIVGAALLGFLGSASAALADVHADGSHTTQVSVKDLDLTTAAGQRVAYERVHQMARELCEQVSDPSDLSHQVNFVRCVDAAMAGANAKVEALISRATTTSVAQNSGR